MQPDCHADRGQSGHRATVETVGIRLTSQYVREKLRKIWPGIPSGPADLRRALGDAVMDVGRLTVATVLGYLLTVQVLPPPVDLTGALTALLVVQASLSGSFRAGMVRVAAVVTGITVALAVSTFVGLHWWSLALVVFIALLTAKVLRLEGAALEAAISGMLILGSSGADVAAATRFATTLIGTLVGVTLPLVWPRRVRTSDLTQGLRLIAGRQREVYDVAAQHLRSHPMTKDAADGWLTATRRATPLVSAAATTLGEAADVQKWNTRQLFQADVVPLLRHALEILERTLLASSQLFHVIKSEAPAHPTPDDGYGDEVRGAFAIVLAGMGRTIEDFVTLVGAEASGDSSAAEARLDVSLGDLRESYRNLVGLMKVDPNQTDLWLLRGSILSAIEGMMSEFDLTRYVENRDEWRASQLGRALPAGSIGPRIRSPWGLAAQRRLRTRAAASRAAHPEGSHQVASDDTTTLMPAQDQRRHKPHR